MSEHERAGVAGAGSRPPVGVAWCVSFPPLSGAVRQVLDRLPARQNVDAVGGRLLWLPRLAVTVLPQVQVRGGWLCTLAGAAEVARLPTGVLQVSEREIVTAVAAGELVWPSGCCAGVPDLDIDVYGAAWRLRLATVDGGWFRIGAALAAEADPVSFTVGWRDPVLLSRAGCRTTTGWHTLAGRLQAAGFLRAWFEDTTPEDQRRWGLTLPAPTWPPAC